MVNSDREKVFKLFEEEVVRLMKINSNCAKKVEILVSIITIINININFD